MCSSDKKFSFTKCMNCESETVQTIIVISAKYKMAENISNLQSAVMNEIINKSLFCTTKCKKESVQEYFLTLL